MTVAVAVAAAKTSTGHQDITTTDLSGTTPKAVLFLYSRAAANGTINADAGVSHGMSDGTNQFAAASFIRHGATGSSVTTNGRVSKTTKCLVALKYNGSSAIVLHSEAAFVAFIPNGVTVDWTTASADGWLITALFLEGSDWTNVHVGTTAVSVPGIAVSLGFQPNALIVTSALDGASGAISTDRAMTALGFAAWNPNTGVRTTSQSQQFSWYITRQLFDGASTDLWVSEHYRGSSQYFVAATQDAAGFTLKSGAASSGEIYGYLAVKYEGAGVLKVGNISLGSAAGHQSYTGFGGTPGPWMLWILRENQASVGSFDYRLGASAMTAAKYGGYAVGGFSDNNLVGGAHPMIVHSTANQDTITMLDSAGVVNITATLVSFDIDGLTLNYTVPPVFHPEIGPAFAGMTWMYLTPVLPAGGERVQAWIED